MSNKYSPFSALQANSQTSPLSTTANTSSMVTEDSAMLVAKMTFTLPSAAVKKFSADCLEEWKNEAEAVSFVLQFRVGFIFHDGHHLLNLV
jgi:hypothetical protein